MLTSDQLQVIRECAKDEASFQKIVSVIDVAHAGPDPTLMAQAGLALNLNADQVSWLLEVFETLPVSVYVKDRQSRFVLANRLTSELWNNIDRDELIGKTDFDFMDEVNAQRYFDAEQLLFEGHQPVLNFEIPMIREQGGQAWYLVTKAPIHDSEGRITGLVGVNQDITERKLAETALAEERNVLQTIIDHIPDKIYIKDRESRFVLVNHATAAAQQFRRAAEMVGTTDFDHMKHDRAQQHFDGEQTLMRTGQPIVNQELFVPEYLRGPLWFLVTKVPVFDDEGQISGLVGINRDITKHKLAEEKVLALTLEAERSNILADFIADASHEFRTAVTIIQTSAYLLGRASDYEQQQQFSTDIVDYLNNLLRLIDSLITMADLDKTRTIGTQPTNLNDMLRMRIEQGRVLANGKTLTIEFEEDDTLPLIEVDRGKLDKALSSIISNAVCYTPDNGRIIVQTFVQDAEIIIEISDDGIGMTEEVQSNIFKRFYRVDNAHTTSGFGLGLPIAQRIVDLHQGRIEVESVPGQGSTFRVILPHPA